MVSKCLFQPEGDLRKLQHWSIWSEGQGQSDFLVLPAIFKSCFLYSGMFTVLAQTIITVIYTTTLVILSLWIHCLVTAKAIVSIFCFYLTLYFYFLNICWETIYLFIHNICPACQLWARRYRWKSAKEMAAALQEGSVWLGRRETRHAWFPGKLPLNKEQDQAWGRAGILW